jgi:hypothetical protein
MTKRSLRLRAIVEFLVVIVCTASFVFSALGIAVALLGKGSAGSRDFVEYWAAGHLLTQHANPYDSSAVLSLERSAGYPSDMPALVMANPPYTLPLMLPLGLLNARAAELAWILLLIAGLAVSIKIVRSMHGNPKNLLHLLGYSFAPVLSCLLSGQVSIFLLLGLVLFLRFHRTHPFWAGAALWLCMLKPHLFLSFGVVLLLWIFHTRSYRILAGVAASLVASSAAAMAFNPPIWTQYQQMMKVERVDRAIMQCLGSMLRMYVPPHTILLQCLPAAIGCVWALAYFVKRRDTWDWIEDGSLVLLVSVFTAPYTWFMDQAVLIPALLHRAYTARSRALISILALLSALVEIAILRGIPLLHSTLYIWTAPAWLLWYIVAMKPSQIVSPPPKSLALEESAPAQRETHMEKAGRDLGAAGAGILERWMIGAEVHRPIISHGGD